LHLSLTLDGERGTNLCGSAGRDLCRATPEESLEVAGYAEQLEPQNRSWAATTKAIRRPLGITSRSAWHLLCRCRH